ncbi:hypothetical protein LJC26_06715 [Desulfovibrio sp. OttesenSCG-928-O18]|nr:hypothetical protein [Desulfovibrio sp. OttesenSCG-928-O18]
MSDSWCGPLHYKGKKISGGAARNARIANAGGMDEIIDEITRDVATKAWNAATLAANQADGGKVFQMPKRRKVS